MNSDEIALMYLFSNNISATIDPAITNIADESNIE